MIAALLEKVRSGALKPLIHGHYTFEQAPEALRMLADRKVIGKCILLSDRGIAEAQA
jgi:NADPH:quinone reductase-like Zn-dependent oxidoreductase